ncbi:hypothetical protein ACFPYI_12500 [Halomarina salina]|uniref:Uncharacterized protein n=1 Tax=Halomarina salina TaxID=1872699 RepID=A0ABD5RP63_9EURY|nr:hypothetical protein [Halomarina salina]
MTSELPGSPTARTVPDARRDGPRRSFYDLFGTLRFEVRGEGGRSTAQFREMFRAFETPAPTRPPDVVVERTTEEVDCTSILGGPTDHYGWTGDAFVVRNGDEHMRVEPGWDHIWVTPDWEPFYAVYPVEFRLRQRLVEEGRALVHAAGVRHDGRTTLFPAWRGAGKTNTTFALLREGAEFLADDRLWVGADGTARGYPLAVNLHPRNARSFSGVELQYDGLQSRLRASVDQRIQNRFGDGDALVDTALSYLSSRFVGESVRYLRDVRSLFPRATSVDEAPIDDTVLLATDPNASDVTVERVSDREMLAALRAIAYYEWNERLGEYFHAYDALVPGGSAVDELHRVVDAETRVLQESLDGVGTYRVTLPRAADWSENDLGRAVVRAVESLGRPTATP